MIRKKSRQISWIGSLTTLSLLLIYLASSIRLDSIHQLFHAEKITELHTVEKETDPCHKNIYHHQKEKGCEHKSHITQNTKCPFCEHNANSKTLLQAQYQLSASVKPTALILFFQQENLSFFKSRTKGRSPPQI